MLARLRHALPFVVGLALFMVALEVLRGFGVAGILCVQARGVLEAVYNFQGLRAYKDKFNPVWEPRYLAYPGGLRLSRIMADVSALVAGGYRHIFRK